MCCRPAPESGLRSVPLILLGGAEDWPEWLDPVTDERWTHILVGHEPGSTAPSPNFALTTDIPAAIYDTIVHGYVEHDTARGRRYVRPVNGQVVVVAMRPSKGAPGRFFVASAYPRE